MFISPQQAAVADIVGSKARGGTAVATFQMMSDFGAILGSLAVGQIAQYLSFGSAFVDQRRHPADRRGRLGVRAGDPAGTAVRSTPPARPLGPGGRWRACPDQRF